MGHLHFEKMKVVQSACLRVYITRVFCPLFYMFIFSFAFNDGDEIRGDCAEGRLPAEFRAKKRVDNSLKKCDLIVPVVVLFCSWFLPPGSQQTGYFVFIFPGGNNMHASYPP